MKSKRIALAAILMSALSTSALASHDDSVRAPADPNRVAPPSSTSVPDAQPHQLGKTRAQVRQELIDARRDGAIPTTEADYPPSQRTIDANRARNRIFERYWSSNN
ncbi:DUF4148 domain-containing protein [Paraburkholderia fungorum]|uniref:DUF4148 domain-containing protein n=1 Tax=Paraburkholderia fungorum TaxID=134537 RepID=UPI0038BCCAAB